MIVLSIIGIIIAGAILYWLIIKINDYINRKYNFELFEEVSGISIVISYLLIYFGQNNYFIAIAKKGDELNGILMIAIGAIILFTILINNIRKTSFFKGIFFTTIQFILYIPITAFVFIIILLLLAVASQTKPVYNINSK